MNSALFNAPSPITETPGKVSTRDGERARAVMAGRWFLRALRLPPNGADRTVSLRSPLTPVTTSSVSGTVILVPFSLAGV